MPRKPRVPTAPDKPADRPQRPTGAKPEWGEFDLWGAFAASWEAAERGEPATPAPDKPLSLKGPRKP
jgi:hypothetical protein